MDPARLAALTPAQRALLAQRLGRPVPPLDAGPRPSPPVPIAPSQQLMWRLARLWRARSVTNDPIAFHVHGPPREAALRTALETIWRRHDVLRATFRVLDGEPHLFTAPPGPLPIRVVDLTDRPDELPERLAAEGRTGMRCDEGPLLRLTWYRLARDHHVLARTTHHLVGDGWSQGVFVRELLALWAGEPVPELPVQYADYARWQRARQPHLGAQVRWWREHLDGARADLELPADLPGPRSALGAKERRVVSGDLLASLAERARTDGVTLYTLVLAALELLVGAITGRERFVLATFAANRARPELENLHGWFVNTHLVRADLAPERSVRDLVRATSGVVLGGIQAHPDVPLDTLADALGCPSDRLPFTVLLAFDLFPHLRDLHRDTWTIGDTTIRQENPATEAAECDLGFWVRNCPEGVDLSAEYNAERFSPALISRWLTGFERALQAVATTPGLLQRDLAPRLRAP